MAIQRNVTATDAVFVGEDKQLVDTIYQADGTTLQNITGWGLNWMLKRKPTDADAAALVTKTTAALGGITLTTPAIGLCTIDIADTDTDGIQAGTYFHELKRTDSGLESVLTYGTFVLRQAVHRA